MVWFDFYAGVAIAAKDVQAIESLAGSSSISLECPNEVAFLRR